MFRIVFSLCFCWSSFYLRRVGPLTQSLSCWITMFPERNRQTNRSLFFQCHHSFSKTPEEEGEGVMGHIDALVKVACSSYSAVFISMQRDEAKRVLCNLNIWYPERIMQLLFQTPNHFKLACLQRSFHVSKSVIVTAHAKGRCEMCRQLRAFHFSMKSISHLLINSFPLLYCRS